MFESPLSATKQSLDTTSFKKSYSLPPAPAKDAEHSQLSRAMALGSYFVSGLFAINASQFLGAPLYLINEDWYNAWVAFTKESWGLLVATMTQCWAPTIVRVSGDKSVRGQISQSREGDLLCKFPSRLILIANHQIYTDWLYLWWIGYTAGMHGHIFIILKESLKRIPVIGWGMQFYQFIFLKRNWELDKPRLALHMQKLNKPSDPMWLMMFPEGTNLAPSTREASKRWADQNGLHDMRYQLLPRSTGLHFCLQNLRKTVEYVYDCTIAYEGVPSGQYAQDIFTVQGSYLGGHPPASVNMYWRRFRVDSIPVDDPILFDRWLRDRWTEKDMLLSIYYRTGRFPADEGAHRGADGKIHRGAGYIESEVKSVRWYEFLQIFAPVGLFAMVLYMFYGAIPKQVVSSADKQVWGNTMGTLQKALTEKSWKTESSLLNKSSSNVKAGISSAATRTTASSLPNKSSRKARADFSMAAALKTATSLLNESNSKAKADNSPAATRKIASSLPDKSSSKVKVDISTVATRKTASSLPDKTIVKSKGDNSIAAARKTASSIPDKSNGKAKADSSTAVTRKTASSIPSKSSSKTKVNSSITGTRKTAISLPSSSPNKAKADNSVAATRKTPPKLGMPGARTGKSKNEKPALGAMTIRTKPVHTTAQETKSGGQQSSKPINPKAMARNQPIKPSSSSRPSKELATQATKKVIPKVHQPERQPQSTREQLESRPGGNSAPKKLQSQNMKPKSAVKGPSNVAVPKPIPVKSKGQ